jgi:Protein of unknown function (DUF1329)
MKDALTWAFRAALALSFALATTARGAEGGAGEEVAPGLHVGDMLDTSNAAKAKDLLPPEILKHYETGEYRNKIIAYPLGTAKWERSFLDSTEKNAGQLDVDDTGTIVFKGSGQQPDYVYGIPFPTIDPKDPKAAVKIVWNQFLAYWSSGSTFNIALVSMLQPKSIDREIHADGYFQFYDGQAEKYRRPNPLNLQSQFLGVATFPTDLDGTASLTWRYRDPAKRDSVWAYVPALRRVRAISPANRSDGYLGSDISGDDGFFFDGKPQDFDWKLIGKRDAFRVVDPDSVSGPIKVDPAPGGGWEALTWDNPPMAGYQDPSWPGVAWAPMSGGLAKRPVWVIEATPKDKYYLYGKVELWIDAETWSGSWNRKFSWQGELVHDYQLMGQANQAAGPPGPDQEYVFAGKQVWACAENFKMNRATLGGMRANPKAPFVRRAPIDTNVFDAQALARYGK